MKQIKRIPFTKEGLERVKDELEELKKVRPEAVLKLAEARSLGDLSENGLYTAAKARLRSIDSRIFNLSMQIKLADIISNKGDDIVSVGSIVETEMNGTKQIFHLVGDLEADPLQKKITQHSPLGKALMGRKVDDEFSIEAPAGSMKYKILEIKNE